VKGGTKGLGTKLHVVFLDRNAEFLKREMRSEKRRFYRRKKARRVKRDKQTLLPFST